MIQLLGRRMKPARKFHGSTGSAGALDATFTRLLTFDELFSAQQDQALRRCRELLEAEALDVELAAALSVAQLERVLTGQRLGDIMRVRKLLQGARVMVEAPSVGCSAIGRLMAAGTLRGDLQQSLVMFGEVCIVMSSLLFTVAVTWLLSPVQKCAFEDDAAAPSAKCAALIWVDSMMWLFAAMLFLFSATCSWFMMYHFLALTHEELPPWMVRNSRLNWIGVCLAVMALVPFTLAISTRCWLIAESELRGWWMAGITSCSLVLGFAWWFATARAIHGFGLRTLLEWQLGAFGFTDNFHKLFPGKFAGHQVINKTSSPLDASPSNPRALSLVLTPVSGG